MKKNKIFTLLLIFVAFVVVLAACNNDTPDSGGGQTPEAGGNETVDPETEDDGQPSVVADDLAPNERVRLPFDETVTVNIAIAQSDPQGANAPEDLTPQTSTAVTRFLSDLNIDLNYTWIVPQDQFSTRFQAELASGNIPDIMMLSPAQFQDLYEQGALLDFSEAWDLFASDEIVGIGNFDGSILNSGRRGDGLFGIPNATHPAQYGTSQIWYRMDILREAGLAEGYEDLPTTIDEFETLALALLEWNDGNPIIQASQNIMDTGLSDFTPIFHAHEAWPSSAANAWTVQPDGTLDFTGIEPTVREALTVLNRWYEFGFFPRDFAAFGVWESGSPAVSEVVAGNSLIVMGSWWVPNWPLNQNVQLEPDAEWVSGPNLSVDGTQPTVQARRYPVHSFFAMSRDFEHPEALFKMMQWTIDARAHWGSVEFEETATLDERIERDSFVQEWLPWRTHTPDAMPRNLEFIRGLRDQGITDMADVDFTNAPTNVDFARALTTYFQSLDKDAIDADDWHTFWGIYARDVSETGGVANMVNTWNTAPRRYTEVFTPTPTMTTRLGELNAYMNQTFISMIMGDTEITDAEWNNFIETWESMGGSDIRNEVNEWFLNN